MDFIVVTVETSDRLCYFTIDDLDKFKTECIEQTITALYSTLSGGHVLYHNIASLLQKKLSDTSCDMPITWKELDDICENSNGFGHFRGVIHERVEKKSPILTKADCDIMMNDKVNGNMLKGLCDLYQLVSGYKEMTNETYEWIKWICEHGKPTTQFKTLKKICDVAKETDCFIRIEIQ